MSLNTLPTEIKVEILKQAVSNSHYDALELSATTRAFRGAYKLDERNILIRGFYGWVKSLPTHYYPLIVTLACSPSFRASDTQERILFAEKLENNYTTGDEFVSKHLTSVAHARHALQVLIRFLDLTQCFCSPPRFLVSGEENLRCGLNPSDPSNRFTNSLTALLFHLIVERLAYTGHYFATEHELQYYCELSEHNKLRDELYLSTPRYRFQFPHPTTHVLNQQQARLQHMKLEIDRLRHEDRTANKELRRVIKPAVVHLMDKITKEYGLKSIQMLNGYEFVRECFEKGMCPKNGMFKCAFFERDFKNLLSLDARDTEGVEE